MAELKKKSGAYNMYTMSLSYGELVAIESVLADNHSGPVADELYGAVKFYLDELPKPGEEEEKKGEEGENGSKPIGGEALDELPDAPGEESHALNGGSASEIASEPPVEDEPSSGKPPMPGDDRVPDANELLTTF